MTLSEHTISILKNFSTINSNLVIKQGSVISTIADAKNVVGIATVSESFPQDVGLYDLGEFLGIHSLIGESPDLDFSESSVKISSGRSKATYRFADQSILTTPKSAVKMPASDLTITISADDLAQVRKAASTLGHALVSIKGNDGVISLVVTDPKNTSANSYELIIDNANVQTADFDLHFLIGNLKVITGSYEVCISSKLISHWKNLTVTGTGISVEYYVALEKTSVWNG